MDPDEFNRMIQTFGGSPTRWPTARRKAALRHVSSLNRSDHTHLGRERLLDGLLDTVGSPEVTPALRTRVMATIPPERVSLVCQHPWWSGAGLVGVATVGVAAGILSMSLFMSLISHGIAVPGSPDGAFSFRQDAFAMPSVDTEGD